MMMTAFVRAPGAGCRADVKWRSLRRPALLTVSPFLYILIPISPAICHAAPYHRGLSQTTRRSTLVLQPSFRQRYLARDVTSARGCFARLFRLDEIFRWELFVVFVPETRWSYLRRVWFCCNTVVFIETVCVVTLYIEVHIKEMNIFIDTCRIFCNNSYDIEL